MMIPKTEKAIENSGLSKNLETKPEVAGIKYRIKPAIQDRITVAKSVVITTLNLPVTLTMRVA